MASYTYAGGGSKLGSYEGMGVSRLGAGFGADTVAPLNIANLINSIGGIGVKLYSGHQQSKLEEARLKAAGGSAAQLQLAQLQLATAQAQAQARTPGTEASGGTAGIAPGVIIIALVLIAIAVGFFLMQKKD